MVEEEKAAATAEQLCLEKYDFGSELSVEILCRSVTTHFEAVKSSSAQLDGTGTDVCCSPTCFDPYV